mmetsp:Transcript_46675/g.99561  ORF Transcript_46675/g.99561 Transcript_46675/m.99561 type:complete len:211 (-) Transcript_46675:63-695(-)
MSSERHSTLSLSSARPSSSSTSSVGCSKRQVVLRSCWQSSVEEGCVARLSHRDRARTLRRRCMRLASPPASSSSSLVMTRRSSTTSHTRFPICSLLGGWISRQRCVSRSRTPSRASARRRLRACASWRCGRRARRTSPCWRQAPALIGRRPARTRSSTTRGFTPWPRSCMISRRCRAAYWTRRPLPSRRACSGFTGRPVPSRRARSCFTA